MKHIHNKTGVEYEVGVLNDFDGKTFDMCVITKWDTEKFEESPVIIDYYFGGYDPETTDEYIDDYLERQECLKKTLSRLEGLRLVDHEVMEQDDLQDLDQTIEKLSGIISTL